jgi:hypothetical protein
VGPTTKHKKPPGGGKKKKKPRQVNSVMPPANCSSGIELGAGE